MPRHSPSLRVLVVDDDPVLIDLIPWLLSVLGHKVETAATGALALHRLATSPPLDIVLIDLRMPDTDGATLAAAITALPHPPRLIGMSGGDPTPAQATHFDAFLHKPFGMENLKQVFRSFRVHPTAQRETTSAEPIILDTAIYHRLAASLPPARLQDLYDRTLKFIRQTAPAFDTASLAARSELAHSLHGSCAMVGAVELATLAAGLENASHGKLEDLEGSFLESPPSYKILMASERLERILRLLHSV